MKIRVLSDLHLERSKSRPCTLRGCAEDLVVLAGDIGIGTDGIEWAKRVFPDCPVVYVLGNHEFHGQDWDLLLHEARMAADGSQVHVLEQDAAEINGLRILGCSLWTDFSALGPERRTASVAVAHHEMPDYRLIRRARNTAPITAFHTMRRCEQSKLWLDAEIEASIRPLLVVTHHAPTLPSAIHGAQNELSNAAYHNDSDYLVRAPVLAWVHGHTRAGCDRAINGVRIVSNQRRGDDGCDFDWDFVIDVPVGSARHGAGVAEVSSCALG